MVCNSSGSLLLVTIHTSRVTQVFCALNKRGGYRAVSPTEGSLQFSRRKIGVQQKHR
jgi:hypothetical protein